MAKLNHILLTISVFFVCYITQAQELCISSSEALGEYIGELFIKQKGINKEPFYTSEIDNRWRFLLKVAKEHNMISSHYHYDKTYFNVGYSDSSYTVYIAFKSKDDVCAIKLEAIKDDKLWSIKELHGEFYKIINPRKNIERFIGNDWVAESELKYPFMNEIKPFKLPNNYVEDCYPSPITYLNTYFEELLTFSNMSSSSLVLDLEAYKEIYIPQFQKVLNKVKTDDEDEEEQLTKMKSILLETQDIFYTKSYIDNINAIANYIQTESYTKENIENVEFFIQNFKNQIFDEGKILFKGDIILNKENKKEGIPCSFLWSDNTWKIVHQQKYTYGIQDATEAE